MKTALEILKEHFIPYVCCKEYFDHCIDSNNVVTAAPQALKAMEAYASQFPKSSDLPPQPVKGAEPMSKKELANIIRIYLINHSNCWCNECKSNKSKELAEQILTELNK